MRTGAREKILADVTRSTAQWQRDNGLGCKKVQGVRRGWISPKVPWGEAARQLEALSDKFHAVSEPRELSGVLTNIVREHEISRAVRWDHPLLEKLGVDDTLRDCGVEVGIPSRDKGGRGLSARADLGITAADAFVMESGTIVLRNRRGRGRTISLLPPVHLAIVTSDQRLASVEDLSGLIRYWGEEPGGLRGAVTMITGHSRTADIELTLVSGVHGPGIVHVIGMDPLPPLASAG